jgi:hypothetical protein
MAATAPPAEVRHRNGIHSRVIPKPQQVKTLISDCQFSFPIFDGHMHFSQACLDEAMASYGECGIIGGIKLWGAASTQYNFVYHAED